MKNQSLMKKAREVILTQMSELGEITTETVMELIRPHFSPDLQLLREQALRRTANNMMRGYKDENGIRVCFNCKNDSGDSVYINIDKTKNLDALKKIENLLNDKYMGLNASKKKVNRRKKELSGQIRFEDISGDIYE